MPNDLSSRLTTLETVYRIYAKVRSLQDPREAFSLVASELKTVSNVDFVALFLLEKGSSQLRLAGYAGIESNKIERMPPIKIDEGFRGMLTKADGRRAVRFNSPSELPRVGQPAALELGIEKTLICPIEFRGEFIGYLALCSRTAGQELSSDLEQLLVSISDVIGVVIDNIRATEELRRSKEETERLLSMAPIGIFTCDSKGIFRSVNTQMLSILERGTEEEIVGTSVFEVPAISRSGLDALIMEGMEGHEGEKTDVHFVIRQDKAMYLHVKVTPVKSESGRVQGVLAVAMDITSKIRLQNQLERSYEKLTQTFQEMERVTTMKTQFIDIVSHELRTPLTVMRGYIELVESEYASKLDPKFVARLKTIKANTDKLYGLVESMLDVSRLEKGSLQIHTELISLEPILEEVVKARMNDAEQKKQSLTLDIEGELPPIKADKRRMKDVFDCLVDNALKYTQEGGRVRVSARDEGRTVHFWVKDNGVGIPLDSLGKIFDRFHIVASDDLSHQVNRLGLGLPIAKGIVEAHQGRIWVESQVGKGSVFHVDLPKEPPK